MAAGDVMKSLLLVEPRTGVWAPQQPLLMDILVPADAIDDDEALIQGVIDFVNRLRECLIVSDEYPAEADWSYWADYYFAQVSNGGHEQYAHNSGLAAVTLRDCRLGLHAMGAIEYLEIFDAFLDAIAERGADEVEGKGRSSEQMRIIPASLYGGAADGPMAPLDQRFFALNDMQAKNAAWLRTLPNLKAATHAEIDARFAAIEAANPAFAARKAVADANHAAFLKTDPTYRAAIACAAQEGATFDRLTAGNQIGEIGIEWGAQASSGFRYLRIINDVRAEWRDGADRALRGLYYYDTNSPRPADAGETAAHEGAVAVRKGPRATPEDLRALYGEAFARYSLETRIDHETRKVLMWLAAGVNGTPFLPRKASPAFAIGATHATARLSFATILFAQTMRGVRGASGEKAFESDYDGATLMTASAALACAGAASIRIARSQAVAAMAKASDQAALKREQFNLGWQLMDIAEWHWMTVLKIGAAFADKDRKVLPLWRRPSFFTAAERLIDATSAADSLERRLAYFERDYVGARLKPLDAKRSLRRALTAFEHAPFAAWLDTAAHLFRRVEAAPIPGLESGVMLFGFVEPSPAHRKPKTDLTTVFTLADLGTMTPTVRFEFAFDKVGLRTRIEA